MNFIEEIKQKAKNYNTERKLVAYTDNFKTYVEQIKKWLMVE